jgi:hypothetical protein
MSGTSDIPRRRGTRRFVWARIGFLLTVLAVLSVACAPEPPDLVTLELASNGAISIQSEVVELERLPERLDDLRADRTTRFVLSPVADTPYIHLRDVIRRLDELGVARDDVSVWDVDLGELVAVAEYRGAPWNPAPEVKRRLVQIRRELEQPGHFPPWAGEYYYGDLLGTNARLHLAPKAGFAFTWDGCKGLYGQNLGSVRCEGARIYLHCERENDPGGFGYTRTEFVHVPWGERTYLIAPEQMIAFGNDIKAGAEPRRSQSGLYLMRAGDEDRSATGTPRVPGEFAAALEAPTIKARIVEVLETTPRDHATGFDRIRVRLDLGLEGGAYREMRFVLVEPEDNGYMGATIESVDEEESIATILHDSEDLTPEIGWRFIRDLNR